MTQKRLAFYKLYQAYKSDPTLYLKTWEFGGEIYIKELDTWELMSYKCPARISDIYQENPGLLEREQVVGKSGAKYYQYRFAPNPTREKIKDKTLSDFYLVIKSRV